MHRIVEGLKRFQSSVFGRHRELFERLAHGQSPDALFITCSDSRINPNLLTQTGPGELFIMRNAGNLVPVHGAAAGGEGATVEFAVTALGVKDIIVCGHSHCGAMKGLMDPESLTALPAVKAWLGHAAGARTLLEKHYPGLAGEEQLARLTELNVLVQLDQLRTQPSVQDRLSRGEVTLHGWVYQLESGEVRAYDPEAGRFVSITSTPVTGIPQGHLELAI